MQCPNGQQFIIINIPKSPILAGLSITLEIYSLTFIYLKLWYDILSCNLSFVDISSWTIPGATDLLPLNSTMLLIKQGIIVN